METSMMGALAGMGWLATLVMIVGSILLASLMLYLAFRLVVGHVTSYLRAIGVVLLTVIASLPVYALMGILLPMGLGGLFALVVQFFIGAAVTRQWLLTQDGRPLAYARACMVQLVNVLISVGMAVGIIVVLAVAFGTPSAHMQ